MKRLFANILTLTYERKKKMQGDNFVQLIGKVMYPTLKNVGEKNTSLFQAKLAIPINGSTDKFQYIKIKAWGNTASSLGNIKAEEYIKVHGHIEESSYQGKCKACGGQEKKFWTDVVVDNFGPATETA
jgi:hypothetical protein